MTLLLLLAACTPKPDESAETADPVETADPDADGDGAPAATDCDDGDDAVFPGAPEVPDDGVDSDCSGADSVTCFTDDDDDGFGAGDPLTHEADCPIHTAPVSGDCADTDPTVFPGAEDVCWDDIDHDCDPTSEGEATVDGAGYATLQDALDAAPDGATVTLCARPFFGTWTVRSSVTLDGGATPVSLFGDGDGPVIRIEDDLTVNVRNLTITDGDNPDVGVPGGGVSAGLGVDLTLEDCVVSGNQATEGGGIGMTSDLDGPRGTLTLLRTTVSSNTASGLGGGILLTGDATFEASVVAGNLAAQGGGVAIEPGLGVVVAAFDTPIQGNEAEEGGGIYLGIYPDEPVTWTGGDVSGNVALRGGGLFAAAEAGGGATVTDVRFATNAASDAGGGVYTEGDLTLDGCAVEGNDATGRGGGLWIGAGATTLGGTVTTNVGGEGGGAWVGGSWAATGVDLGVEGTDNHPSDVTVSSGAAYTWDGVTDVTCTDESCG